MIIGREPLSVAELSEIVGPLEEDSEMKVYLKKFSNLSKEKALKLKEEIRALDNLKIKEANIVKIVDFLPRNSEDLNKILTEVSMTEEETNAILTIVSKY